MLLLCSKASLEDSGHYGCNIRIALELSLLCKCVKSFLLVNYFASSAASPLARVAECILLDDDSKSTPNPPHVFSLLQLHSCVVARSTHTETRLRLGKSLNAEAGACTGTGLCKATTPECKIAPHNFSFVGSAVVAQ